LYHLDLRCRYVAAVSLLSALTQLSKLSLRVTKVNSLEGGSLYPVVKPFADVAIKSYRAVLAGHLPTSHACMPPAYDGGM
jgi:hypothetical protein